MNDEIESKKVRLIDENGIQVGIVSLEEALKRAKNLDLDVVEIQPKSDPPVVKIMNYGKFQFSINKKKSLSKKKQKEVKIKEVKFRPNTGTNDYLTKLKNLKVFLTNGNKTKITICFKGREIIYKKIGITLINRICTDLDEFGKIESDIKYEGKNITAVIYPHKK
ncbi:MAG TPA: translation initiation factor IF-3 [Candidatus Azoamicus sp. OHIO1]